MLLLSGRVDLAPTVHGTPSSDEHHVCHDVGAAGATWIPIGGKWSRHHSDRQSRSQRHRRGLRREGHARLPPDSRRSRGDRLPHHIPVLGMDANGGGARELAHLLRRLGQSRRLAAGGMTTLPGSNAENDHPLLSAAELGVAVRGSVPSICRARPGSGSHRDHAAAVDQSHATGRTASSVLPGTPPVSIVRCGSSAPSGSRSACCWR